MDTKTLLPCPFCGSDVVLTGEPWMQCDDAVGCDDCNAEIGSAEQWNRRAVLAQTPQDAGLLQNVRLKFTSGNNVPVERAWITRKEWDAIERILQPNVGGNPRERSAAK